MKLALKHTSEQKGQVLIIVALLTTVLLGMVAMVLDVGLFMRERQHLQNVVDAAALAGAQDLPDNATLAGEKALDYAQSNDSDLAPNITFRCIVGDRDHNGQPDSGDIGVVCDPGGNGSFTCGNGICASLCNPSEGDRCNTIVVEGSKNVPFIFARAISINSADTGNIQAAACRGACGGPPTTPLDVVTILDRSSSMNSTELADAKIAAKTVLQIYNPNLQHVALGVLGPSLTTSTCGSPNSGGLGLASSSQTTGSWVPVPLSSDYQTGGSLNNSSLIVKSINCLNNSSVGTNLGDPVQQASDYLLANGRAGVKKAILLFTDGAANEPSGTSANTGYLNCGANAAVTSNSGDNNGYQTTPANACADGGGEAQDSSSGTGTSTSCTDTGKDRHDFYNYNVSIPSNYSVAGIQVRLDARIDSTSSSTRLLCVQLSWNGGTSWTTAKQTSNLTTSQQTYTLGSTSDDWGHTWAISDLSNANFRIRVTDVANSTSRTFSLDWAAVRITYSQANNPCNYAVQQAQTAQASDIEIFSLGYGLQSEDCSADSSGSPYYNLPVTQALAAIATDSVDETGCDSASEAAQENSDGDHFFCETDSAGLSALFQQAAEVLAAGSRLIQLP